jgi:hypothetical protein
MPACHGPSSLFRWRWPRFNSFESLDAVRLPLRLKLRIIRRYRDQRVVVACLLLAATALLISIALARPRGSRIRVLIPSQLSSESASVVGCVAATPQNHELRVQQDILCSSRNAVEFDLFRDDDWNAVRRFLDDALSKTDIVELPFEACPESVPAGVRRELAKSFAALRAHGIISDNQFPLERPR